MFVSPNGPASSRTGEIPKAFNKWEDTAFVQARSPYTAHSLCLMHPLYIGWTCTLSSKWQTLDSLKALTQLENTLDRTRKMPSNFPSNGWRWRASVTESSLRSLMW